MKITVLGSTGGTGRAAIQAFLAAGHEVVALARNPERLQGSTGLTVLAGDATIVGDVETAVAGSDAVVVSLGNSQNPFAMLFGAVRTTPQDICEVGTRHSIAAMRKHGIRRLVIVTGFGVGETRALPSLMAKVFFKLLLKEHIADKEKQEILVKNSGLDWTLVQPVALTDGAATGQWFASTEGKVRKSEITRADLATFIAAETIKRAHLGKTVSISG
jgi:uncharacterized protein YbjT (DUF2867 family)